MTQTLDEISDEEIWIAVGEHFEYLVREVREVSDRARASLIRMDDQDRKHGVGKYRKQ